MWELDVGSGRLNFGPGMTEVFGDEAAQRLATLGDFSARVHPADRGMVMERLRSHLQGRTPAFDAEFRFLMENGSPHWVRCFGESVPSLDGAPQIVAGTCVDADAPHRARASLAEARATSRRVRKARDQFLANASHELRTPLHGLVGMLQLATFAEEPSETAGYLDMAQQAARQLQETIGRLLDMAHVAASPPRSGVSDFEPAPFFSGIAGGMAARCADKGLSFCMQLDGDLPAMLRGDARHLSEILHHLLDNAVRFTERGEVALVVSALPGQFLGGVNLLAVVRDSGPGIPPEKQEQVFEPFALGEDVLTKRNSGMGLGLALARSQAEGMGGRVWCESEPGSGSSFHLLVPMRVSSCTL
ncbi:PAS/PAC sensor signal transduction histidine kinase [Desulfovibrio sp. X2]|uniref:sensor histidine kinase n=1 Tax=Desulfovibrio sp. X2 TaxID=941449 RepID=UPI000358EC2E|nr:PAS domain-containing sensor histidine kinase [Desulfovibrio sp. X2]EPR44695.1 PAS/PAC sensor signal transduction histidine kinase [Desulfovibrio sp. X2]